METKKTFSMDALVEYTKVAFRVFYNANMKKKYLKQRMKPLLSWMQC